MCACMKRCAYRVHWTLSHADVCMHETVCIPCALDPISRRWVESLRETRICSISAARSFSLSAPPPGPMCVCVCVCVCGVCVCVILTSPELNRMMFSFFGVYRGEYLERLPGAQAHIFFCFFSLCVPRRRSWLARSSSACCWLKYAPAYARELDEFVRAVVGAGVRRSCLW